MRRLAGRCISPKTEPSVVRQKYVTFSAFISSFANPSPFSYRHPERSEGSGRGSRSFPQILRCSRQANPGRGDWHAKFYETRQRHPVGALPVKTVGSPARPKSAGRPVANPACVGVIRVRSQEEQGCRPRDRAPKSDVVVESRRHAARPEGSIPLRQRRYAGEPTGVRERGMHPKGRPGDLGDPTYSPASWDRAAQGKETPGSAPRSSPRPPRAKPRVGREYREARENRSDPRR
jgi:hypothetical protein